MEHKENAMSREWTKEPWLMGINDGPFSASDPIEGPHAMSVSGYGPRFVAVHKSHLLFAPDAERAIACVNACAPLSDPTTSIPALLRVAEAARKYVADWDSQVADPRAACFECEDPDHIALIRAALSALPASDERGGA